MEGGILQSLSVRGSVLLFLSLFSFNRFGGKWQTPSLQKYLHHYFTVAEGVSGFARTVSHSLTARWRELPKP